MSTVHESSTVEVQSTVHIPRVAIQFCVQCKWNLRAAYYAQELLQTFSASLGEISLIPRTGGIFSITLYHQPHNDKSQVERDGVVGPETGDGVSSPETGPVHSTLIWERKRDGGFPETKELKNRIRNIIDPQRDMGHIDRSLKKGSTSEELKQSFSVDDARKAVQVPGDAIQASGGESLQFGSNIEPQSSDGGKQESTTHDHKTNLPTADDKMECEDCK